MKVLITGTSSGIGIETARHFLLMGHEVIGIDKKATCPIDNCMYSHVQAQVQYKHLLPDIDGVEVLINNAGTIDEESAISTNLEGYINVIEKYALQPKIKSVVNVASISGHVGLDTMRYAASQGGRLALTKHLAIKLGKAYRARVNSISPGAVMTGLEPNLYANKKLVEAVANENLLHKWIDPKEIAQWIYFVAVINKSMTGQDVLIDNGEVARYNFIDSRGEIE